ncbi:D-alanine--D-alanine ligase [Nocardioides psychrotolerans]|uniref:D-alanine--D-alanine ligase n=1 Tax=Nocardioides psychrotolerans TaxID=1005945 RepID=A0A1I3BAS0_9ACTN|nr:D-alanine--D-alanine ligase family protein [Nocardioides psychrotolerans]GEP36754.1 D-alanine--D-alanine ligase [Nocardioides psychrotolerans]SFH59270.1 D-alanine-D-alanine ligase [Nocardioides psychrotolerans]
MKARTRVAVIGGGRSCEHDVSTASAASVAAALDHSSYDVVRVSIDPHGTWLDGCGRPIGLAGAAHVLRSCDVVLPVVHGPHGEDGTLAALCELAGLPYVGSGVGAGAVAMDKWVTKLVAGAVGVATTPGVLLTATTAATYVWTHPVVVKPVAAGSSHGVSLVDSPAGLAPAVRAALEVDARVLVEDVVGGREIDIAVIARPDGSRWVSPTLEIVVDGLFDFAAKYDGDADFRIPAVLTEAEQKALEDAALAVFDALDCRGVARVDFFLTEDGPVLNEVNTMPGFTATSQVPQMYAAAGLAYPDLLDLLVRDALAAGASCG